MQQRGLMLVASNAELEAQELARVNEQREAEERREGLMESQLAGHIRRMFEMAKRHKEPVEQQMLANLRQINARYSATKEGEIKEQGLPLIYMKLTSVKCRAAKSWIRDVLMPAGDKPWSVTPTPEPSLPPMMQQQIEQRVIQDAEQFMAVTGQMVTEGMMMDVANRLAQQVRQQVQREAEQRCERMADHISDQLTEGGWNTEFDDVISDVVDFPAAIIKGPVVRKRRKLMWDQYEQSLVIEEVIGPEVERVDPFNFYPCPGVVDPEDGDCIEYHPYSKQDLYDLIGLPGYREDEIREALRDYQHGLQDWGRGTLKSQQMHARGEHVGAHNEAEEIGALEYWGAVQGEMLLDWGMAEDEVPDPDAMYDIMAVLVGQHVICVRFNPDPLGRKPYSKACFEDIPGAFWGKGVPELIEDCQGMCNAAARSLVANMGIASGPQVAVNVDSVPPGQSITNIYPWKIWQLNYSKTGNSSRPPIDFFQPNPMVDALLKVFDKFSQLADEYSGIPAYTYGTSNNMGGAARTASGLSMLMNAASKAIKNVVKHIDTGLIAPTIQRFYDWNMLYHHDNSLKGDAQVVARGALSLVAKEQNQMRLQELLGQTANPIDMQIIGLDGRAAMLRRALQGVDVGGDDIVPSVEDMRAMLAQQQMMGAQQGGMAGGAPAPSPNEQNVAGQPMGGPQ